MKKLAGLFILGILFFSCGKAIEEKKEDIILDAMTSGQWYVYSFKEGDQDLSTIFSPYSFQFYRDGKLSGITESSQDQGTWEGNLSNKTIATEFPNATEPLSKLNAVWKVTNNTWDYVKAEATVNGVKNLLWLKKK